MTLLKSTLLGREGFEHGFGTKESIPDDFPVNTHILLQVHGEKIVALTEQEGKSLKLSADSCQLQQSRSVDPRSEKGFGEQDLRILTLPADPFRFDEGDAMASDIPGVSMGVRTADCLPVLIADRRKGTAAAVHCGWRSLAMGLAGKVVRVMQEFMECDAAHLLAAIGPSIGPCCYEVGEEVRAAFLPGFGEEGLFERRHGSLYLDLASGGKTQLIGEGVSPENVDEIVGCTSCNTDLFWSHRARRDEERMVSFITVREAHK